MEELVNLLPAEENVRLRAMRHRNSFLTLNRSWTGIRADGKRDKVERWIFIWREGRWFFSRIQDLQIGSRVELYREFPYN